MAKLPGSCVDDLVALVENGPCWDGDVPSKSGRDALIKMELASRIPERAGYTAATPLGLLAYMQHFGDSATVASARAFRIARRAVRNARVSK